MKKYKLVCTVTGSDMFGHLILWVVFVFVSFGLLAPFWLYSLVKMIVNGTELHEIEQSVPAAAPRAAAPAPEPEVMPRPKLIVPKPQV